MSNENDQLILRGRQPVTVTAPRNDMADDMRKAEAVAKCGDMIPPGYRGKPGGVLLAMDFAAKHNMDLLSVFQGVSFVNGRPMLDADISEEFANRNGYQIEMVELVEGVSATHRLLDTAGQPIPGAEVTSTMQNANPKNPVWKTHPTEMLIANSKRRLCKYWARGVPASVRGLIVDDETVVVPDPVAVVKAQIGATDPEPATEPAAETELFPTEGRDLPTEPEIRAALKADGITQVRALRALSQAGLTGDVSSIKAVAGDSEAWQWLNNWIANGAPHETGQG